MGRVLLVVALAVAARPSFADNTDLELDLGNLIASEEFCGLSYDQDAIRAFINKRVGADDLQFASGLQTVIDGTLVELQSMSLSAKTAHCTQTERVARHYGFIK